MTLQSVLVSKKDAVVKRWFELIAQTHPDGGVGLKKNKDRFANPVRHITLTVINELYDELMNGEPDFERVSKPLWDIIRVRAIQDVPPSQAVSFIFLLKTAVRSEVQVEKLQKNMVQELYSIESRIDKLAGYAFDIYMSCREKIYKVRVDEMKATVDNYNRLMERISNTGDNI